MPHHPGAIYLLSNGRSLRSDAAVCYYHHARHLGRAPHVGRDDGIWAEISTRDPGNAGARRVVAWLCPQGEAILFASRTLHTFRDTVRRRYPDTRFVRYPPGGAGASPIDVPIGDDE